MTEKRHGKGLLFIVTLVLAAGVIKYADIPFAQTVREKAASALSGAANADHVLAVFGGSAMPACFGWILHSFSQFFSSCAV